MSTANQVNSILSIFDTYAQPLLEGALAYEDALTHIKAVFNADVTLTFPQYEELRSRFHSLNAARSETARNAAWSRLTTDCGVNIPKSTTPEAVAKAAKRKEESDALAAMELPEIEKALQTALKDVAPGQIKKYKGELDRRARALLQPEQDAIKAERRELKAAIDKADKATLDKIKKLLKL